MAAELQTWSGKKRFRYEFSRSTLDVRIFCGEGFSRIYQVEGQAIRAALRQFCGKETPAGTNRTNPPTGSIGDWFLVNWKRGGIISYLGPILIEEGYAKPGTDTDRIYINPFQS